MLDNYSAEGEFVSDSTRAVRAFLFQGLGYG
jgi:hypothetical protein